jgi:hypothetical protein
LDEGPALFPDRANKTVTISLRDGSGAQVTIFNSHGQLMMTKNTTDAKVLMLDVGHLSTGVYVVKILNGTQSTSAKFIIR